MKVLALLTEMVYGTSYGINVDCHLWRSKYEKCTYNNHRYTFFFFLRYRSFSLRTMKSSLQPYQSLDVPYLVC